MERRAIRALRRFLHLQTRTRNIAKRSTLRGDPLLLAVVGGILAIAGNMLAVLINNHATIKQEELKAQSTLLVQAMATGDQKVAERNIKFFIASGSLKDTDGKIEKALGLFRPYLPPPGGAAGAQPLEVSQVARLYNFPTELDGSGQVIGLFAFGGGYRQTDIAAYFGTRQLPVPKIEETDLDGARNIPSGLDDAALVDIEVIGTLAPRATIHVYFAPNTIKGNLDAIRAAITHHETIVCMSWGLPESELMRGEIAELEATFKSAASSGITLICGTGSNGVTDGVKDGKPHVDYPASSPWVLAVGATLVETVDGEIITEVASKQSGGGFSNIFPRPDWQSAIQVTEPTGLAGKRSLPDVAALGDPRSGMLLQIGGKREVIGGASASVWTGLIALVNQGLGRNVGYLNPVLYKSIGPAGVLRAVPQGENGKDGVTGYKAGPGWNPVSGWGSPDGRRLLAWLRAHAKE